MDVDRHPEDETESSPVDASALYHSIVESTQDAVYAFDLRGSIRSWNSGASDLFQYPPEEAIGASAERLYDDPAELQRTIQRLTARASVERAEVTRVAGSGEVITVEESLSPVRDTGGCIVAIAAISRDISERRRIEQELAQTRRALERHVEELQRSNAELEQFAYIASHDLSEPLRAVAGMVDLLARRYKGRLDDDADEFIGFAVEGCTQMRAMIDDVLAYSRVSRAELHPEPVPLDGAVADAVDALHHQIAESTATVRFTDLPVVRADRAQLVQVLQNLLSNGLKFHGDRPPLIEVTAHREGDAWRVDVADEGIGIEPQYRERIFRMFQRLHARDDYPGTGIGLAIVERIVVRHGGRVAVDARDGGGTVFSFTLPDSVEAP